MAAVADSMDITIQLYEVDLPFDAENGWRFDLVSKKTERDSEMTLHSELFTGDDLKRYKMHESRSSKKGGPKRELWSFPIHLSNPEFKRMRSSGRLELRLQAVNVALETNDSGEVVPHATKLAKFASISLLNELRGNSLCSQHEAQRVSMNIEKSMLRKSRVALRASAMVLVKGEFHKAPSPKIMAHAVNQTSPQESSPASAKPSPPQAQAGKQTTAEPRTAAPVAAPGRTVNPTPTVATEARKPAPRPSTGRARSQHVPTQSTPSNPPRRPRPTPSTVGSRRPPRSPKPAPKPDATDAWIAEALDTYEALTADPPQLIPGLQPETKGLARQVAKLKEVKLREDRSHRSRGTPRKIRKEGTVHAVTPSWRIDLRTEETGATAERAYQQFEAELARMTRQGDDATSKPSAEALEAQIAALKEANVALERDIELGVGQETVLDELEEMVTGAVEMISATLHGSRWTDLVERERVAEDQLAALGRWEGEKPAPQVTVEEVDPDDLVEVVKVDVGIG